MKKRKIVFVVCIIIVVAAVAAGIIYKTGQKNREQVYTDLAEKNTVSEDAKEPETEAGTDIPVDFDSLKKENADIYAWIRIPDTVVDYPVVQSAKEDDYYLNRTVDGKEGLPGSIFTEASYNGQDFTDKVTVIYGHNMRDDTMFGGLRSYLEDDYLEAHPKIYIYTPEHIYTYRVFGAITYDNRHILYQYDCEDEKQYEAFLHSLETIRLMPSNLEQPLEVTTDDRIIILSTCNGNDSQRFLIGAVLTDEE